VLCPTHVAFFIVHGEEDFAPPYYMYLSTVNVNHTLSCTLPSKITAKESGVQHLRDVGHHTFLIFFLFCYIYMCMCIVFWLSSDVHGPSLFKSTFFVFGFSSSKGFLNFYYTSQTLKIFQIFEGKSFLELNPCHHCSEF